MFETNKDNSARQNF